MNLTDISLTADNNEFLEAKLAAGEFSTASEVVNDALHQVRIREAKKKLADLLTAGLHSGPGVEVTDEWRASERARFLAQLPPGTIE